MRIAFLHTAESNIALFEAAARDARQDSFEPTHVVRADLLAAAERAGALTEAIMAETQGALLALCDNANAVVLTCSTLGPAVNDALAIHAAPVPIVRADAALAQRAVENGGNVVVLYTAPTTREATARLFTQAAARTGAKVDVQIVEGAWERFRIGDSATYLFAIASAADLAYAKGADVVALAQSSMAGAIEQVMRGKPLCCPQAGLDAALHAACLGG